MAGFLRCKVLLSTKAKTTTPKIIAHAPDKSNGHRRQIIQTVWNFIGKLKQDEEKQTVERQSKSNTA
ncbi:MAG: hypothetical protein DBX62_00175 [Clostridia bacterium]|nr:MAG: hypothetical protein DBX62_00175 [Clostridia bacterium]